MLRLTGHASRLTAVVLAMVILLAACAGGDDAGDTADAELDAAEPEAADSGPDDDDSEPGDAAAGGGGEVVPATWILDLTGGAGYCGTAARSGAELAVDYVNEQGLLDAGTLEVSYEDSATDPQQAATTMANAAESDAVAALFGCTSQAALAIAPIAQDAGIPVIAMQSGSAGFVETGDYIFRTTAPQARYHDNLVDWLAEQGHESAVIAVQDDNPTLVELADDVYPPLLEERGIELMSTERFQGEGFDFSALATNIADMNPDMAVVFASGVPGPTLASQLRNAGYEGHITGSSGFGGGVLDAMGAEADGITWVTDFNVEVDYPSTQEFVELFNEANGEDPLNFAAQAWDSVMLLVQGLNNAEELSRDAVRDGIQAATEEGFDGAVGPLTFEERDARVEGIIIEWRDGGEHPIG